MKLSVCISHYFLEKNYQTVASDSMIQSISQILPLHMLSLTLVDNKCQYATLLKQLYSAVQCMEVRGSIKRTDSCNFELGRERSLIYFSNNQSSILLFESSRGTYVNKFIQLSKQAIFHRIRFSVLANKKLVNREIGGRIEKGALCISATTKIRIIFVVVVLLRCHGGAAVKRSKMYICCPINFEVL